MLTPVVISSQPVGVGDLTTVRRAAFHAPSTTDHMGTRERPHHLYERIADAIRDHPAAGTARIGGSDRPRLPQRVPCPLSVEVRSST
jgi:hypothetical protein